MAKIFDNVVRSSRSPATQNEGHFRFLNRVCGPVFERIRELLEEWVVSFPEGGQRELIGRLRSSDDRVFSGAFWELFQAEALRRSGFQVTQHPEIAGTTRRPDFLATGPQGSFYVEATLAAISDHELANRRRQGWLYDEVNSVQSPNFWLSVDIEQKAERHPPTKALKRDLTLWLSALDVDELRAISEAGRHLELPEFAWEAQGWRVTFTPLAKSREVRGRPGQTIGIYSPEGGYIDSLRPIRQALREKASRYGTLDRPYVVAVLIEQPFVRDDDVINALFGSVAARLSTDPDNDSVETVRNHDGSWFGRTGPRGTRVSAVAVAVNLAPWSIARLSPSVVLNPWASRPLQVSLGWRTVSADLETGSLVTQDAAIDPVTLFSLPRDWPGSEDPFGDDD